MSFFADNRIRQRLAVDGLTGQEPPLKRLRSILGTEPALGEAGFGAGGALGLPNPIADPRSISAHGTSLLGADSRAWPRRTGLDALAASGLPAPLGSLGTLGPTGPLLGMSSAASAFIERNLSGLDPSQVMAFKDVSTLQANPLLSGAATQLLVPDIRAKTKLCRHFIENSCRYQELCNFAHSIEQLKKMPDEGDLEGKALMARYKAKAEAEKQSTGQDASTASGARLKTKLCKHFIEGTCKFKEVCMFAHSIEELKQLPDESDETEKALLEMYKAKAPTSVDNAVNESIPAAPHASDATPTKTMLCKQYIIGNCRLNDSCTFAHSLGELVSLPAEDDVTGKVLLELYQSKMDIKKPEQVETLTVDGPASIEGAVKTSAVDAHTTVKLGSSSNAASEVKLDDKSVRFLKTRMCKHFLVGACKYNKNCTFAHAIEELKPPAEVTVTNAISSSPSQPVQSTQQLDAKQKEDLGQDQEDKQGLLNTKPCRFFSQGICRFGNACAFTHNGQPLVGTISGVLEGPSEIKPTYKTRLCNMWEKDKTCSFGTKCHFAHGPEELRQRTGPVVPVMNSAMYGALEMEALARAQQLALPSSVSYSYNVTDTNWRPHRGLEDGKSGPGGAVGIMNERILDGASAEALQLRGLLPDYGQLEQAGSLSSLSSLGRPNAGFGPSVFSNLLSWPTR